jgi:hypothetical protein
LTIETQLPGGLTPDDIAILRGIREAIPDAGDRSPAEVLTFVLRQCGPIAPRRLSLSLW